MASEAIILQMLSNPPDPDEPLPLSNRKETIYGVTVPFLILSWMAVLFRLYVRFRIVREPGWDDFFIVLSSVCNTTATILVLVSIEYGLGQHLLYLPLPKMSTYFMIFYVENAIYITQTALIKISLLFQYLRIFKAGTMRWICISLLVIIGLWGITYSFMAWVPCFPVRDYWDRKANSKCYGFGFGDPAEFIALFESHTALNMAFDLAVFMTPMVLFTQPNLRRKNLLAMTGVFLFGGVVVFTSIWRLYTIVLNRAGTHPYIDFTWWPPISILLSCIEIDLAIMCASMPIFWPILEKSISAIFITREIHVTEHRRIDEHGLAFELEHTTRLKGDGEGREGSIKSDSGHSRESLTRGQSTAAELDVHYKDQYVVAQVDPFASQNELAGNEVEVETMAKPKWRI